jgi:gas vesicle protein GvpN
MSTSGSSDNLDDHFISSDESFVETEAVTQVKDRIRRWLAVDRPVHLIGPTGCGKTAMATHLAQERERPVVWINGDADLTTSDLVGEYGETEQITEHDKYIHNVVKSKNIVRDRWVDNPLTIAVREGATLVYNEFSRTKPVANNVLLSVFEEGVLELPGQRGESRYVDVHPEFRAVLTSNSVEYAGVHEPQDALLDRLVGIYMDHYDHETEAAIISSHVSDPDAERIEPIVDLMGELRDRLDIEVGTRAGIMAVEGLEYADDPDRATLTNICVDVLASKLAHHSEVQALRQEVEAAIDKLDTTAP